MSPMYLPSDCCLIWITPQSSCELRSRYEVGTHQSTASQTPHGAVMSAALVLLGSSQFCPGTNTMRVTYGYFPSAPTVSVSTRQCPAVTTSPRATTVPVQYGNRPVLPA